MFAIGTTVQTTSRDVARVVESNPRHPGYRPGYVAIASPYSGIRYVAPEKIRKVA